jgi:hypothetical protein
VSGLAGAVSGALAASAPSWVAAIEASGLGQAIRQSVWLYPVANVTHVIAVAAFAGTLAILNATILGWLPGVDRLVVMAGARRVAIITFIVVAASGAVLFVAEASHLVINPVFLAKVALIVFGLMNAAMVTPAASVAPPRRIAIVSLVVWASVIIAGRSIAYA